jgi:hypothetical protein
MLGKPAQSREASRLLTDAMAVFALSGADWDSGQAASIMATIGT